MKHQIERKTGKNAAGEREQTCAFREGASAPNSALVAAYETDYMGLPKLESSILSRLTGRPQPQIPTAENEADRLSAGVAAGGPEEVKQELGSRLVADFYNAGGSMFGRRGSSWSFDAPGVRGLRDSERGQVTGMFGHTLAGPGAGETAEGLADRAALYQFAEGTSRADPRANRRDNEGKLREAPDNTEDYQTAMGRIALMDLVSGNKDRIFGLTNFDNWTEDREQQRIHLIDNAYERDGGMGMDSAVRGGKTWDQETRRALTNSQPGEAPSLQNFFAHTRGASSTPFDQEAAELVHGGVSEAYQSGATEAAGMLPQIYGRLRGQYARSSGGHMDEHQTELLRRINAVHGMLNPDALPLDMPARPAGPAPRPEAAPKRKWWQRLFDSAS